MRNQTVALENGIVVEHYQISGTHTAIYAALEPRTTHHSITTIDGKWYGHPGSQDLPAELDALKPMSDERYTRVHAWLETEYQRSYQAILAAFPEAASGTPRNGEIVISL